jgi:trans-aconitate 2-methyltransferase
MFRGTPVHVGLATVMLSTPKMQPTDWDANTYHRVSSPQFAWGLEVLARLSLKGDETVVDAGCGTGKLTAKLLERLPRGKVIALDSSPAMLAEAKVHLLPTFEGKVSFVQADLQELHLDEVADALFSTATFHWVLDHRKLFAGLYRALRSGGRLVAQCGAEGNLHRIHHRALALMATPVFAPYFQDWSEPFYFADEESTRSHLLQAGFQDVQVHRIQADTPFPTAEDFREFIRTVVLRNHLARITDATQREALLDRLTELAASDSPPLVLDYWRLNISARKP